MSKTTMFLPLFLLACSGPSRGAPPSSTQRAVPQPLATSPSWELSPLAQILEEEEARARAEAEALPEADEPLATEADDPHPVPEVWTYTLRRGETPSHFASWSGLPVETIAEASGLDLGGSYPVGTVIVLPVDAQGAAQVETTRQVHHARRAEGWLASKGVAVHNDFHTVRTGETAWSLATEQLGVPVWLLEVYNPSVDLEKLRAGQQLMVPVLADTVVDADLLQDEG